VENPWSREYRELERLSRFLDGATAASSPSGTRKPIPATSCTDDATAASPSSAWDTTMGEQRVTCAVSETGACRWVEHDPDDGRPCWSLCALDIDGIQREMRHHDD